MRLGRHIRSFASTSAGSIRGLRTVDSLFEKLGSTKYDSFTTQEEHARVTAYMAQQKGAGSKAVVTAFLHDVGHLLLDEHSGQSDFLKEDKCHEQVGYEFLRSHFGAAIA